LSLFFILGELFSAPNVLDSQSFLLVLKLEFVVFEGFSGTFNDGLVLDDGSFEELFSVSQSLVLLLEVGGLSDPVGSLSLFGFSQLSLGSNQLLSDLAEEIEDLDDGLVVNLGGQLGEGADEGLEEGVLAFSEFSLDLLESGLDLGESNTGLEVLNNLGGLIDGFDLLVVFGILVNPGLVLLFSEFLFGGESVLVVLDVLGDDSDFLLSLSESVGGVLSQLGEGDDLSLVVSDGLLEVVDEFLAGHLVILVHGVSSLLVSLDLGGDVVHQEVDLVDGSTSRQVELDDGKDRVAQGILVDLSENLSVELVLLSSSGQFPKLSRLQKICVNNNSKL
jgi:hypothetical protein